ncbi:MAG TPA: hypothetical protein VMU33_02920 [Burkholderiaceae bacterium]|nr:hypothetical protein [Burkholderiaceae bacterium]
MKPFAVVSRRIADAAARHRPAPSRRARAISGALALACGMTLSSSGPAAPAAAAAPPRCPDMILGAADLNEIFDETLAGFRDLIDQRSVTIEPSDRACYVRVTLASTALPQVGGAACRLQGCSIVVYDHQSVALRDFDVAGCDAVFDTLGLSRRVPSAYADASARIRQHCGSAGFEIAAVSAVRIGGDPKLRIAFRPTAARP